MPDMSRNGAGLGYSLQILAVNSQGGSPAPVGEGKGEGKPHGFFQVCPVWAAGGGRNIYARCGGLVPDWRSGGLTASGVKEA